MRQVAELQRRVAQHAQPGRVAGVLLEDRPRERRRTEDRVAYLFPRPEATEWNVRELNYDRRRRSEVRVS